MPLSPESAEYLGSRIRNLGPVLITILGDALIPETVTGLEADLLFEHAIKGLYAPGHGRLTTDKVADHSVNLATYLIENNPNYEQYSSNPTALVALFKRGINAISRDGGYNKVNKLMDSLHEGPDALAIRNEIEEIAQELRLRRAREAGE